MFLAETSTFNVLKVCVCQRFNCSKSVTIFKWSDWRIQMWAFYRVELHRPTSIVDVCVVTCELTCNATCGSWRIRCFYMFQIGKLIGMMMIFSFGHICCFFEFTSVPLWMIWARTHSIGLLSSTRYLSDLLWRFYIFELLFCVCLFEVQWRLRFCHIKINTFVWLEGNAIFWFRAAV